MWLKNHHSKNTLPPWTVPGHQLYMCHMKHYIWAWILSCIYMGHDRQRDCNVTAAQQNKNIGIQQKHLHGNTPGHSGRPTAESLGSNLILNLNCRTAQAVASSILWRTRTSKIADTGIICRSCVWQLPTMWTLLPCSKLHCSMSYPSRAACRIPSKFTFSVCIYMGLHLCTKILCETQAHYLLYK